VTDTKANELIDETFENRGAPISTGAANLSILQLMKLVPTGGSRFGLSKSFIHASVGITISEDESWRIAVAFEVPSKPTLLCAQLATWGVKAATRKVQFVFRAEQLPGTTDGSNDEATPTQLYTILNGDYPNQVFVQRDPKPQNFRDEELRDRYGAVFATTNYEDALKVIRSEITGEKAFD
jgi:hypothetical protein